LDRAMRAGDSGIWRRRTIVPIAGKAREAPPVTVSRLSVGPDHSHLRRWPVFYMSLIMSSILFLVTTLAVWQASNRNKAYGLCCSGLAFGIVPGCMVLSTYLLPALVVGIAAPACLVPGRGPSTFFFASLAAFAGTYGYQSLEVTRRLDQLAQEFPFEPV